MNIRVNDTVVIRTGNEAGKKGKVLKTDAERDKVIVEGANYIWKHVRRTQETPAGGRVQREAPIHVSNVMLFCTTCNKGVRIRRAGEKPDKARVCTKCGGQI